MDPSPRHDPEAAGLLAEQLPDHASADEVLDRIGEFWTYWRGLPVPREPIVCPCGATVFVKDWTFHRKRSSAGSSNPWRCDVQTKCGRCSRVDRYGVMLPPPVRGEDYIGRSTQRVVHWREVAQQLRDDLKG